MKPRLSYVRHFACAALFLCACVLLPIEARADSLVMTGGSGTANTFGVVMNLTNADAAAQLRLSIGRIGITNPIDQCFGRCMPGETMNLTWRALGGDIGGGPGQLGGLSGTVHVGGGLFTVSAQPIVIPTGGAASYTFVVPFTATGNALHLYVGGGSSGPPTFILDFSAQGLATVIITRMFDGSYRPTSVTYQVNGPVPEPATLLLLGTGLAGVVAGARRKRLRKREG
jgi:hypothetical protein